MSSKIARSARSIALAAIAAACVVAAGCGGKGDKPPAASGARVVRDLSPDELLPVDLDLVIRIDVGRMRAGLGQDAVGALRDRAMKGEADAELSRALEHADVVWIAARVGEMDLGDRVVVVEGKGAASPPSRSLYSSAPSPNGKVTIFDRRGDVPRAGFSRLVLLGDRAVAFVSPVERDAVARVLDGGADQKRGVPSQRGIVSADLRVKNLSPKLAREFPSLARIVAGVDRVRASAVLEGDGLRIDGEILARSPAEGKRTAAYVAALLDSLKESKYAGVVGEHAVEDVEGTVRLKWIVPAKALLKLLGDT